MKRLFTGITVLVLALTAVGVMSAQSDPRIGTWKLNVAKSKSDTAPHKSETRTYEVSGDSTTLHVELINNDGSKQVYGYTGKLDGKDYRYTGQVPGGANTVSVKRGGNQFDSESKKDGKLLYTTRAIFSDDGKIMTLTTKGTDANGQAVNSVRVYDKQ
jgi:hypothetical protein